VSSTLTIEKSSVKSHSTLVHSCMLQVDSQWYLVRDLLLTYSSGFAGSKGKECAWQYGLQQRQRAHVSDKMSLYAFC
jgi:hypothetical protein